MRNLTPRNFCFAGSCPSVHDLGDGRLMIVGLDAHDSSGLDDDVLTNAYGRLWAENKVGVGETVIVIDRALLANVDRFPSNPEAPANPYEPIDPLYVKPQVEDVI